MIWKKKKSNAQIDGLEHESGAMNETMEFIQIETQERLKRWLVQKNGAMEAHFFL